MSTRMLGTLSLAGLLLVTPALAACGESGSSGTKAKPSATAGSGGDEKAACEAVPGEELVVLEDDKQLQTVDNVIPAINAEASSDELVAALDAVSTALTTEQLIGLNKQTDLERKTSPNVAKEFAEAEGITEGLSGGSGKIVIGAFNFSESQTLANLYAEAAKAAGFDASVKTVGNREVVEPALEKGQLDVVPEYVGTLTEFINKAENGAEAEPVASSDLDATVEGLMQLGEQVGLVFGQPSEAADQNAFAVTKAFADQYGVATLSELAEACGSGLVLGGPPECPERPFCQPGLEETYGLTFDSFSSLDAGGPLSKTALQQGEVTLALVFSSDAALSG
ncbi:MAG: glycine/betaine ABC transporter substrate-binding protein [Sporichthyaceae bacterium]|nr:glycine/betaine ABC transporter substrate-binding protein [Sporichthyaceae bacterium]